MLVAPQKSCPAPKHPNVHLTTTQPSLETLRQSYTGPAVLIGQIAFAAENRLAIMAGEPPGK